MIFDYRNVYTDPSKLPPFLPQVNYYAKSRLTTDKNELIFEMKVYGSIKYKVIGKRHPKRNGRI